MLARVTDNTSTHNLDKGDLLREVMVKIGLERIDMQEGIMVEALLDSGVTGSVMSSEFARKQRFKLKKLDRPMYVRNMVSRLLTVDFILFVPFSFLFYFTFLFLLIFYF